MSAFALSMVGEARFFAKQWAHWCAGTTHPRPGPRYTIIEADDGIRRDKSTDGTIEGLPVENRWHPSNGDNLLTQSWCVVESADSASLGSTHFQMFLRYQQLGASGAFYIDLYPFADWAVDPTPNPAPPTSTPTKPERRIEQTQMLWQALPSSWCMCSATESSMVIGGVHTIEGQVANDVFVSYTGEAVAPPGKGQTYTEVRPFVQTTAPQVQMPTSAGTQVGRITNAGQLDLTGRLGYDMSGLDYHVDPGSNVKGSRRGGAEMVFRISVSWPDGDTDAVGLFGWLRNLFCASGNLGDWGYFVDRDFVYYGRRPDEDNVWVLDWDSETEIMGRTPVMGAGNG